MGHIITGTIVILLYFIIKNSRTKRDFERTAKIVATKLTTTNESIAFDEISKEKTGYYVLDSFSRTFKAIDNKSTDLQINELDYSDLFRFKQMLSRTESNEISDKEFFNYKNKKHLIFPFKNKDKEISLLLLERENEDLDSTFNRKRK